MIDPKKMDQRGKKKPFPCLYLIVSLFLSKNNNNYGNILYLFALLYYYIVAFD